MQFVGKEPKQVRQVASHFETIIKRSLIPHDWIDDEVEIAEPIEEKLTDKKSLLWVIAKFLLRKQPELHPVKTAGVPAAVHCWPWFANWVITPFPSVKIADNCYPPHGPNIP